MKIAVVGASGKMGRAVVRLAHQAGDAIVCAIGAADVGRDAGELAGIGPIGVAIASDVAALASSRADVVIDFSSPAALVLACKACATSKIAIVSGTTGIGQAEIAALDDAAKSCAVLWEPNMSIGVHVLAMLVEKATAALGPAYDVEIVETHHRAKVDAPSGTALRLGDAVKKARAFFASEASEEGGELEEARLRAPSNVKSGRYVHGREGKPGPRDPKEIGMHALRGGDVIGDHTVSFFGDGERIELTHRASSRDLFAHGALRAARWLAGRAPARYTLADTL